MDARQIQAKLWETAQAKVKAYPCNNVRASEIGHPCERYIVLSITHWEDKKPYSAGTQNIFDLGNALEAEVIRRFKEAGYELLTASRNFRIDKPLITGREDIMLMDADTGELVPVEIKGLAPNTFDAIDSIADMLNHRAYYIRKYPAQLQVYMLHFNKERGFFALFNKISGAIKIIEAALDYEYAESLLQKAESVYRHIDAKTLPEPIADEGICTDCPLLHICGAKIDRGNAVIDTGELEELLVRRETLLPYTQEYEAIRKRVKALMRTCNVAFTPNYMIRKKVIHRRPFIVNGGIQSREVITRIGVRP